MVPMFRLQRFEIALHKKHFLALEAQAMAINQKIFGRNHQLSNRPMIECKEQGGGKVAQKEATNSTHRSPRKICGRPFIVPFEPQDEALTFVEKYQCQPESHRLEERLVKDNAERSDTELQRSSSCSAPGAPTPPDPVFRALRPPESRRSSQRRRRFTPDLSRHFAAYLST